MAELLECVPNFSEGRDQSVIDAIGEALRASDVTLLDVQSDRDHNRSVFTLIGPRAALVEATFESVRVAVDRIDLRRQSGAHPRLGAADVVPFVPLLNTPLERAVEASRELGARIAEELKVPVYFYEEAATRPDRRQLENVRRKGFEELRETIDTDPSRAPDLGPSHVHPTAGAVVVGARKALIAFNIYLGTTDLKVARSVARTVRQSSGGLRYVKALGFDIPERGCVQVSMNLTDHKGTAMNTAFELVREAAASYGIPILESEVVGMIPATALFDVARHYLRMHGFSDAQVLEMRLLPLEAEPS